MQSHQLSGMRLRAFHLGWQTGSMQLLAGHHSEWLLRHRLVKKDKQKNVYLFSFLPRYSTPDSVRSGGIFGVFY